MKKLVLGHRRKAEKQNIKMRTRMCTAKASSEQGMEIAFMNSLQLWFPAQDLYRVGCQHFILVSGEGFLRLHPSLRIY